MSTQPPITWVGMTTRHYTPGRPGPIRAIVLHATAGRAPGDLAWLHKGGDPARPISCHYYIDKAGRISQFVRDEDTAWHAGLSNWTVDGVHRTNLNPLSVGIELSNLNTGDDPYPAAQVDAAVDLCRYLVARYDIPRSQFVRHFDISPTRKTDPAGFPWTAFVERVYAAETVYTVDSPILGAPLGTEAQASLYLSKRSAAYTSADVASIVLAYRREGETLGLDWFLALAQCAHETGGLTSWWSARPRRNPAGLGVTGRTAQHRPSYSHWALDGTLWREGLSFACWDADAVRAHLGRLLAYALPAGSGTPEQQAAITQALALRPLPPSYRGCAPTLAGLVGTWAVPGADYADAIARTANAMREVTP